MRPSSRSNRRGLVATRREEPAPAWSARGQERGAPAASGGAKQPSVKKAKKRRAKSSATTISALNDDVLLVIMQQLGMQRFTAALGERCCMR